MSRKYNVRILIHKTHFSQTTYHYLGRFTCFINDIHRTEFLKFQTCRILGHNACIRSDIRRRTTSMECTQCQLCTRLTDRLCSDDTNSFSLLNHTARRQVTSVTLGTDALLGFTSQYRTNFNTFYRRFFNLLCNVLSNFITASHNQFACCRMHDIVYRYTSQDAFVQCSNSFIIVFQSCTNQSTERTAVFFINNHIM